MINTMNVLKIYSPLDECTMNVISTFNQDLFSYGGVIRACKANENQNGNFLYISIDDPTHENLARVETISKTNFFCPKKHIQEKKNFTKIDLIEEDKKEFGDFPLPPFKRIKMEDSERDEFVVEDDKLAVMQSLDENIEIIEKSLIYEMSSKKNQQMIYMALKDWQPYKNGPLTPVIEEPESNENIKRSQDSCKTFNIENFKENKEQDNAIIDFYIENESKPPTDSTLHNCPSIETLTFSEVNTSGDSKRIYPISQDSIANVNEEIQKSSSTDEHQTLFKNNGNSGSIESSESDTRNGTDNDYLLNQDSSDMNSIAKSDASHSKPLNYEQSEAYFPLHPVPVNLWRIVKPASSAINRRKRQIKILQDNAVGLKK